jgi:geranylgeranyl reductase family protein
MPPDIAIIGAGPSGAWTAYLLARAGARVTIFDPSHPREKPCGGGVTERAMQIVAPALAAQAFPSVPIRSARFVDTGQDAPAILSSVESRSATVPLSTGALVVASRAAFDGALLAAACRAGATLTPARVRRIDGRAPAFHLETADGGRHAASQLVGADGANSLVRRTLGRAFRREQLSIATGFFAHGHTSDQVVIELTTNPPGYLWSFPRPDHLAIGICAQADAGAGAGSLRARAREWIGRAGLSYTRLEPYSWPIPSLSAGDFASLEVAGEGWYLVGDAAGLVDPITREGIYFSLVSAQLVAAAILDRPADAGRCYADRVRTEILDDLACGARLKAAFFRPHFTRLLLSALLDSRHVRAVMADLVAGAQPYRSLKWRLAKTMEIGLAWRLLRSMRSR